MSELDEKLEEIIDSHYYFCEDEGEVHFYPHAHSKFREQIKQAFVDDGWMKLDQLEKDMTKAIEDLGDNIRKEHNCMTGQEWYDRFSQEHHRLLCIPETVYINSLATVAAKRAAGIDK